MLKTQDIPPEELSEVVRIAGEMQDRESAETRQRKATVDAAEEMGIPAEYMERAAAEVHARRVEAIQAKRRRRNVIIATVAAAAGLGLGATTLIGVSRAPVSPPPPQVVAAPSPVSPLRFDFNTAESQRQWTLDRNAGTEATVSFETEPQRGGIAVIRVQKFGTGAGSGARHRADFDTINAPPSLAGYQSVSFRMSGKGLQFARLYLEKSSTERWRSPAVPITSDWAARNLNMTSFEYQTRRSASDAWRGQEFRAPDQVQRLSFKLGDFMNPKDARGEVAIDDLQFE